MFLRSTTNTEPASQVISLGCSWPTGVIKAVHHHTAPGQDNDCAGGAKSGRRDGFLTHVWLPQMHRGSLLSPLHWCSSPRESSRRMTDEHYHRGDRKGVSGGVSLRFVCGRRGIIVRVWRERARQLTAATHRSSKRRSPPQVSPGRSRGVSRRPERRECRRSSSEELVSGLCVSHEVEPLICSWMVSDILLIIIPINEISGHSSCTEMSQR